MRRLFVVLLLLSACSAEPAAAPPGTVILFQPDPALGPVSIYPSRDALVDGRPKLPDTFLASRSSGKHIDGFAPSAAIRFRFEGPAPDTAGLPKTFAAPETAPIQITATNAAGEEVSIPYRVRYIAKQNALVIQLKSGLWSEAVRVAVDPAWKNVSGGAVAWDPSFVSSGSYDGRYGFSYPVASIPEILSQVYDVVKGAELFSASSLQIIQPPTLASGKPVTALVERLPPFGWDVEIDDFSLAGVEAVVYGVIRTGMLKASPGFPAWPPTQAIPEEVTFLLTLPAPELRPAGEEAFPIVVFGHGYTACKETLLGLASTMAKSGIAVIGIDVVGHGERASGNTQCGLELPSSFGLSIGQIEASLVDTLSQLRQLIDLLPQIAAAVDVAPADGRPDFKTDRVGYLGQSLGTHYGSVLTALDPRVAAAVMNVGHGGVGAALYARPEEAEGPGAIFDPGPNEATVIAGETSAMLFDPLNFTQGLQDKMVLLQQAEFDHIVPAIGTEWWALALDAVQERGAPRAIPNAETLDFPVTLYPGQHARAVFAGVDHIFLLRPAGANAEATGKAQEQAAHFLRTALVTGEAEVLPTR